MAARCRARNSDPAIAYLRDHPEIWEGDLSPGGDPMILSAGPHAPCHGEAGRDREHPSGSYVCTHVYRGGAPAHVGKDVILTSEALIAAL